MKSNNSAKANCIHTGRNRSNNVENENVLTIDADRYILTIYVYFIDQYVHNMVLKQLITINKLKFIPNSVPN